jgi:broad specificity phosphatase PhoE
LNRILFVRHGSTDTNAAGLMRGWTDDPLSDLGRRQATATAAYLSKLAAPDAIYCSNLPRAVETARVIAARLDLPICVRADLRELNLGTLEGRSEAELWGYFMQQSGAAAGGGPMRDVVFPNGESVLGFIERTRAAMADIISQPPDSALVVSHGVQTMVALGLWLEPNPTRWPAYRVDNCSVTEVVFDPAPRVVQLNDTRHLSDVGTDVEAERPE